MEASKFLKKCIFTSRVPSKLTEMFKDCIHRMTYEERSRLAIFITGNEYFGGKIVTVDLMDGNDNPLIASSTCFEKLNLPHYQDLDTMYRKICYNIMDRSFGNMWHQVCLWKIGLHSIKSLVQLVAYKKKNSCVQELEFHHVTRISQLVWACRSWR